MVSRKTPGEKKVMRQNPQTLPASLGEAWTAFSAFRTNLGASAAPGLEGQHHECQWMQNVIAFFKELTSAGVDTNRTCVCVCVCTVAQSYLTLCHPMNWSPPDSSVHEISKAEYWSGLPFPSPGDLPNPGIKSESPALAGRSLPLSHLGSPTKRTK